MARPLPPPPLSGRATKKNTLFAASLTNPETGVTLNPVADPRAPQVHVHLFPWKLKKIIKDEPDTNFPDIRQRPEIFGVSSLLVSLKLKQ